MNEYIFSAQLWVIDRPGGWHFITIPDEISREIRSIYSEVRPGVSSISSTISVGRTNWKTSIFYDNTFKAYLLPIKGEVRKKEKLSIGDTIEVKLKLII